ncbi:MAG: branched-chain amino acid ABC transporter permease, partial [Pollutimonas bauzanensis]|uniref:Branched-chain amino acid transport system permease protein n=1 Tax=Pollutimonas bauzanensis TaxID=658167 RepID=A0A1M5R1Q7_9BURK|nr:branched-chain amino acid ABC transporter permease [Pollutimonas bauzanensis]SHH20091.1 branched-chain amino acid transport system permease protein [Pollutimonas bauzanensis]
MNTRNATAQPIETLPGATSRTPARKRNIVAIAVLAGLAALLVLPLIIVERFALTISIMVFITAIAAASLHLIIRTGHISLGHAAFMGIGAYVSAYTTMKLGVPFGLAIVLAFAAPAALALIIGPLVLRLTGKYFVLVTFLLGEIIRMIFVEWGSVTGGGNGIFGVPAPSPVFLEPMAFYYLALGFAILIIGFIARILTSEVGRTMDAVRESEQLAKCSGVPVLWLKVTIFALGCGLAGIAGALQGHFLRYIDPTSFSIIQSLNLVVMNVIGGMYTLIGPLIGTVFLVVLPELLRGYVELQRILFGIIIILVMAFFPGGLADFGRKAVAGLGKRMKARGQP